MSRPPATDKTTLLGIPAPAIYDEVPRAPASMETETTNQAKTADASPAGSSQAPAALDGQSTDTDGFDPYRFKATNLPPGLRSELIRTKLPRVTQEDLKDTLPPNAGIEASSARPSKRTKLLVTGALVMLAIGGSLAWAGSSGGEDPAKTPADEPAGTAIRTATPSSEASVATVPSIAPPSLAESAKAPVVEAPAPASEPRALRDEPSRAPKAPSTGAPVSVPRAPNAAAVRKPLASTETAPPSSASTVPSAASNPAMFDIPIGPKPQ